MAKRRGQSGTVVARGQMWYGRFYDDVPGQSDRVFRAVPLGSKMAMSRTEAKLRLKQHLAGLGINTVERFEQTLKPVVTFSQAADAWLQAVKNEQGEYARAKPSTLRTWQSIIELHLKPAFGLLSTDDIDQKKVEQLVDYLAAKGRSKITIKNVVTALGVVVGRKFSVREKVRSLKFLRPRDTKDLWFTGEQMSNIIQNSTGRSQALFAVAAGTGCRAGELFGLRIEDVNLAGGILTVRRSVWEGREQSPKSENAYRCVGLDQSLVELLKAWIGVRTQGYLFPSNSGTPLREGNVVKRDLWPVLDGLKIPRRGLHAFRHGRVTVLVESGVPMHTIRAWIGHGSDRMVERYTHSRPDYHRQALSLVPNSVPSILRIIASDAPNAPKPDAAVELLSA